MIRAYAKPVTRAAACSFLLCLFALVAMPQRASAQAWPRALVASRSLAVHGVHSDTVDVGNRGSRSRHILVGASGGALAGAVIGSIAPFQCTGPGGESCTLDRSYSLVVMAAAGAAIGALVGALLPAI